MRRYISLSVIAILLLVFTPVLSASVITFSNVILSGSPEVPPNASTATGSVTVTADDVANTVLVSLSFSGLTAAATAAHIHCCGHPGINSPVVIGFTGFPNATSGTYANTFTSVAPTTMAGIFAFQSYVNIHTSTFPGGEIRADLVPEPGTLTLAGLALAALGWLRRRR